MTTEDDEAHREFMALDDGWNVVTARVVDHHSVAHVCSSSTLLSPSPSHSPLEPDSGRPRTPSRNRGICAPFARLCVCTFMCGVRV